MDKELIELLNALERIGYGEFVSAFNPAHVGTHCWILQRENAPHELRLTIDFLLLGRAVSFAAMNSLLPTEIFLRNGWAIRSEKRIVIPALALTCFTGMWLLVHRPQRNPTIYIGHDTFGLMSRLRVRQGSRALDLCSGPGTQGIYMAMRQASVTAVECNFVAAQVAIANAQLNNVESSFNMRIGDLYSALCGDEEAFDLISANPPLLPFPKEFFYPFVGDGGEDGLSITWRILAGLPRWLRKTGAAQIIGTCFSDGFLPCPLDDFRAAAALYRLDLMITMTHHTPFERGSTMFEGLAYTAAIGKQTELTEDIRVGMERIAHKVGATHVCYFSLSAFHGSGKTTVIDLAKESSSMPWFC